MKTFVTTLKEVKEVEQVHCNKCGVRCDYHADKDFASMEVNWGYCSKKDMEKHCWDLCEDCYDEFVKSFKIPVDRFEYSLSGDGTLAVIDD